MPIFDSVDKAVAYVSAAVTEALGSGVLREVRKEEAKQVDDKVYGAYTPEYYKRRGDMGAPGNMPGVVSGLSLTVQNVTPPSGEQPAQFKRNTPPPTTGKDLASVVETGNGYDWYSPGARPFTQATVQGLSASQAHVNAIKKHLRSKGIRVV